MAIRHVRAVQERVKEYEDRIDFSILIVVATDIGEHDEPAFPSLRNIAKRTGCHYNTVSQRIVRLQETGKLHKERKGKYTFYSLPFHCPAYQLFHTPKGASKPDSLTNARPTSPTDESSGQNAQLHTEADTHDGECSDTAVSTQHPSNKQYVPESLNGHQVNTAVSTQHPSNKQYSPESFNGHQVNTAVSTHHHLEKRHAEEIQALTTQYQQQLRWLESQFNSRFECIETQLIDTHAQLAACMAMAHSHGASSRSHSQLTHPNALNGDSDPKQTNHKLHLTSQDSSNGKNKEQTDAFSLIPLFPHTNNGVGNAQVEDTQSYVEISLQGNEVTDEFGQRQSTPQHTTNQDHFVTKAQSTAHGQTDKENKAPKEQGASDKRQTTVPASTQRGSKGANSKQISKRDETNIVTSPSHDHHIVTSPSHHRHNETGEQGQSSFTDVPNIVTRPSHHHHTTVTSPSQNTSQIVTASQRGTVNKGEERRREEGRKDQKDSPFVPPTQKRRQKGNRPPEYLRAIAEFAPKLNTDTFREKWAEWEQHRKEIRKTLKPTARSRQLKKAAQHTQAQAIWVIEKSIENGWTGLFWERLPPDGRLPNEQTQNRAHGGQNPNTTPSYRRHSNATLALANYAQMRQKFVRDTQASAPMEQPKGDTC